VALKASRTSRGVPLLEDVPGVGILFRPLPQAESSLQENIILAHATIFPTLFDLMGLRWAPAVSDLDTLRLREQEFVYRGRKEFLRNDVYDYSSDQVDEFLRIPQGDRRPDLYRTQETIPYDHPNGYTGPGLDRTDSQLQEGYDPRSLAPPSRYTPGATPGNTAPLVPVIPDAGVEYLPAAPLPQPELPAPGPSQMSFPPPVPGMESGGSREPNRFRPVSGSQPMEQPGRVSLGRSPNRESASTNAPPAQGVAVSDDANPPISDAEASKNESRWGIWPFKRKEGESNPDRAGASDVVPVSHETPTSATGRFRRTSTSSRRGAE
jgi:hypothetical protein